MKNLADIVDLDKYPINDLNSQKISATKIRAKMREEGKLK